MALAAAVLVATACDGSSNAASSSSSNAGAAASPSAIAMSPSPSPSPAQVVYTVHLTFSGGLATTVTQTVVDSSSDCSAGKIDIGIVVKGQVWTLGASVHNYHGPGRYGSADFVLMLSSPDYDIWMSNSGEATYAGDTSLSVDVGVTNLMAGPGEPGANAHISGSISCG